MERAAQFAHEFRVRRRIRRDGVIRFPTNFITFQRGDKHRTASPKVNPTDELSAAAGLRRREKISSALPEPATRCRRVRAQSRFAARLCASPASAAASKASSHAADFGQRVVAGGRIFVADMSTVSAVKSDGAGLNPDARRIFGLRERAGNGVHGIHARRGELAQIFRRVRQLMFLPERLMTTSAPSRN